MRVIIFANGELSYPQADARLIQPGDVLIAADGGARHCLKLGLAPKLVIGDFDSLTQAEEDTLQQAGAELRQFSPIKDQTDLELALYCAIEYQPKEIIILGAMGDRWDMTIANLLLLAHPDFNNYSISLKDGPQALYLLHGRHTQQIQGGIGDTISLIPLLGDVHGITTQGLEYSLENGTLTFGSPQGVSNVMQARNISIQLKEGLLLIVHISKP